MANEGKPKVT